MVALVKQAMSHSLSPKSLSDPALELIAARFRALSEPLRLKLIIALQGGERNVNELVKATGKGQANVSRQLQQLLDSGILARRRDGARVFYSIADPAIFDLCTHVCGSLHRQLQEKGKASALFET
jgi:DNA-binding transcriptional ArsR family regulator